MTNTSFRMLIDGRPAPSIATFLVIDPATLAEVGRAPCCTREQLDDAVAAARRAATGWWASGLAARQHAVRRMGEIILSSADQLAALLSAEQGKPLAQALGEVNAAAARCLEAASITLDEKVLRDDDHARVTVSRVPLGVVAAMVRWNFPIILATIKVAAALCDAGERVAALLQVGTVWINQGAANASMTPFAGFRQFRIGVEGGRHGMLEYTAVKVVNRKVA